MRTLEKQEKEGFYTITLGYEKIIEQSIWKNLLNPNDIPTFQTKDIKEFTPGANVLTFISGLAANRFFKHQYEVYSDNKLKNLKENPSHTLNEVFNYLNPKKFFTDNYKKPDPDEKPLDTLFGMLNFLIPGENKLEFLNSILYYVLFSMQFTKKETICNNIAIPSFLGNFIDQTFLKIAEDTIVERSKFMVITMGAHKILYENIMGVFNNVVKKGSKKTAHGFLFFINYLHAEDEVLSETLSFVFKKEYFKAVFEKFKSFFVIKDFEYVQELFFNIIDSISKNLEFLTSRFLIYSATTVGVIVLYRVICRSIINNVMVFEIETKRFNAFLKEVVEFTNPTIKMVETYEKDGKNPKAFIKFRIPNKMYRDENSVDSQNHLLIKNILKNIPQNVFVEKIEFYGYEQNNAVRELKSMNSLNNSALMNTADKALKVKREKEKEKKGIVIDEDEVEVFDIIQVLYNKSGKSIKYNLLTSPEKQMIKYVKQHTRLYNYFNRKMIVRKILFDTISRFVFKPRRLSPNVPKYYTFRLLNMTKENLKLYFYKEDVPWFTHKKTLKNQGNVVNKSKNHFKDEYEVELKLTKFVEKNIQSIIKDIPQGLKLIEVSRPSEGKHECLNFVLFPYKTIPVFRQKCQIPGDYKTQMDKKIISITQELEKIQKKMK